MPADDDKMRPGDMTYMKELDGVTSDAVKMMRAKTASYADGWKKRGGAGVWFTLVRPWDRLEHIVAHHHGNVINAVLADPTGADGSALACVRDIMNYLILIEAQCRVMEPTVRDRLAKG